MVKKREGRNKFLFVYLVVAFAIGLIGLTDSLLGFFGFSSTAYALAMFTIGGLFFFFNIFALVRFMWEKLDKIAWVLPIYHLISLVVFFGLGITLGILGLFLEGVKIFLGILGIITSLFEIGFVLYLLKRFKFF